MNMIDSHFHLNHLIDSEEELIPFCEELRSSGLIGALDIGVDPEDLGKRMQFHRKYPYFHYSAGIYPSHADGFIDDLLKTLEQQILDYRPHALGEIGLDYHWGFSTKERQKQLCIEQIDLADRYGLPVIIHNREADADMLGLLKQHSPRSRLILHCYAAGNELLDDFLDLGAYISFAGNITYKSNKDNQRAAARVPLDRLLIETDSPYLSPVPKRGKKNTPLYIHHTYDFIADLRDLPVRDLSESVCENYFSIFDALAQQ